MDEGGAAHLLVVAGSGTAYGSQGGTGCKAAEGEGLQGSEGQWQRTRWGRPPGGELVAGGNCSSQQAEWGLVGVPTRFNGMPDCFG